MATQRPTPVSVDATVDQQTPNDILTPDSGEAARLSGLHPKYQRQNPYAFRSEFLSNASFRNQYIQDVYQLGLQSDPALQERAGKEPDLYDRFKTNFESNALNTLYKDVSTGEDLSKAIAQRGATLAQGQNKAQEIQQVIAAFPENYQALGFTDGKKLLPQFQDLGMVNNLIQRDPTVLNQVYDDKFKLFGSELKKAHNVSSVNLSDANDVAKAFAVYENYGSEGLTRYVNYIQNYDPSVALEQQSFNVRDAHRFFNTPDAQGRQPKTVMESFIGGPNDPNGQLSWQPQSLSKDLSVSIPKDFNNFSAYFYEDLNPGGLSKLFTSVRPKSTDVNGTPFFHSREEMRAIDSAIANDVPDSEAQSFAFDLMIKARNNEGFSMNDLYDVLANNAEDVVIGDRGDVRYLIDPNKLPKHGKYALEALMLDLSTGGAKAIMQAPDGKYWVEPDRKQRLQETGYNSILQKGYFAFVDRTNKPVFNEQGQMIGFNEQFDPGLFGNVLMAGGRLQQFATDYGLLPVIDITSGFLDLVGADGVAEAIQSSDFTRKVRDFAEFDPYSEVDSFLTGGGAAMMGTDLAAYIAGAMSLGGAVTKGAATLASGRLASTASQAFKVRTAAKAADYMPNTRFWSVGSNVAKMLKESPSHVKMLNVEIGAAGLEGLGGERRSLFANPFLDTALGAVGVDSEIEKLYATSNNLTRLGLDMGASIGAGVIFDNVWAGMKYAGNLGRAKAGKTSRGLEYDATVKDYKQVASPEFSPDWRRFWYNAVNGLQDMPLGELADSKANMIAGRAFMNNPDQVETLNDAIVRTSVGLSDLLTPLRGEIEESVKFWDNELGGKMKFTPEQMTARVDELYQETVDKIADKMVGMFKHQDPNKRDLIKTFTEALPQSRGLIFPVDLPTDAGLVRVMELADANALASRTPHSFVTQIPQPSGEILYSVNRVDDGFWGVQLAEAINRNLNNLGADETVTRWMKKKGWDVENLTKEQLTEQQVMIQRVNEVQGKEVLWRGKRGYVKDFDDSGATIRFVDGEEHTGIRLRTTKDVPEGDAVQQATNVPEATLLDPEAPKLLGYDPNVAIRQAFPEPEVQQLLRELEQGAPPESVLARMRQLGFTEEEIRARVTGPTQKQLTKIEARLRKAQDNTAWSPDTKARKIQEIQDEYRAVQEIADANNESISSLYRGVEGTKSQADNASVVKSIETTTSDTPIKTLAKWWGEAERKARQAKDNARIVTGRYKKAFVPGGDSETRRAYGLGRNLVNQVTNLSKVPLAVNTELARNVLLSLGSDNNLVENVAKLAYNKGKIGVLNLQKPGQVKKNTAVVWNGELYMARQNMDLSDIADDPFKLPSVWMDSMDSRPVLNPYWARTETNATLNKITGKLTPMVETGRGRFGPVYRPATDQDPLSSQVFLNVQNLTTKLDESLPNILQNGYDGILHKGYNYIEVINPSDQAVSVTRVADFDPTFGARRNSVDTHQIC